MKKVYGLRIWHETKKVLFALLLIIITVNALDPAPVAAPSDPATTIKAQVDIAKAILVGLMFLLVVIAAAVYAIGQMFGAETRAKATVWAKSMLTAVGISALLLAALYFFLDYSQSAVSTGPQPGFFDELLGLLKSGTESILFALIFLLVVLSALTYALGQMSGAETRARASIWSTNMLTGALICSVLYVIFFQVFTSFQNSFFQGTILGSYGGLITNIAFFVSALILLTYVVSKVFGVAEWEAYLNVEMSNLTGSFLIVIFVLGFFAAGSMVSLAISGKESAPIAAIHFMRDTIASSTLSAMYDVFKIQTCTSMLNTFSRRIGEAVLTNVFKVFPGIDVFIQITNVIGYGLVAAYGSISAQISIMNLIDSLMIPFMLPAGLILRFFPPTRDAGSFLIALAFSFQFVFPLTYLIGAQVLKDIQFENYDKARSEVLIQSLCGPFKYGVFGVLLHPTTNIRLFQHFPVLATTFKGLLSEPTLNLLSMAEFVPIMKTLALLSLFALFIPAFATVITMTSMNVITKFLTQKVS